jgi:hypothetical protein
VKRLALTLPVAFPFTLALFPLTFALDLDTLGLNTLSLNAFGLDTLGLDTFGLNSGRGGSSSSGSGRGTTLLLQTLFIPPFLFLAVTLGLLLQALELLLPFPLALLKLPVVVVIVGAVVTRDRHRGGGGGSTGWGRSGTSRCLVGRGEFAVDHRHELVCLDKHALKPTLALAELFAVLCQLATAHAIVSVCRAGERRRAGSK